MKRSAFTLVELLIVMAVIAALISVVAPMGLNALKQARTVQVATDFKAVMTDIIGKVAAYGTTSQITWGNFDKTYGKSKFKDAGLVEGASDVTVTITYDGEITRFDADYLRTAFWNSTAGYEADMSGGTLTFSVESYLY